MRCRKVRRIFRYHEPNKLLALGKFTHYVLLLFYLIRDEKELLSGFPPLQQNKLQKQSVHAFVTYRDLVDLFCQFNENSITNQGPYR